MQTGARRAVQAPADIQYGNQRTTGSGSVAGSFQQLRFVGSQARAMLIAAAVHAWSVSSSSCRMQQGAVIHSPTGRRLTYGQLAGLAATQRPLLGKLKSPDQFRLIGTRVPRLDTPAKVNGSAIFGLDVRIPEMLFATVARSLVFGGTVARFDMTQAQMIPGVRKIVQVPSGIAVIADHTWAAIAGRRALNITWNEGANASLTSDTTRQQMWRRRLAQPLLLARHAWWKLPMRRHTRRTRRWSH